LENLKNRFEKSFNAILYDSLSKQGKDIKCKYQDYLDKYKYLHISIPLNTLDIKVENYLLELLAKEFSFLTITRDDLQKNFNSFNPIELFSDNEDVLKQLINIENITNLETFLTSNQKRSLLYFSTDDVKAVADDFEKWLKEQINRDRSKSEENNLEAFLNQFSNGSDAHIEKVLTKVIDIPCNLRKMVSINSGRRFDGSSNDQSKQQVGFVAEKLVYEMLKKDYNHVVWVSKYANKIHKTHSGYNPEGQDGLGYDIEYCDNEGNKYFVEVKGRSDNSNTFDISQNEIDTAIQKQQSYKIIVVTQTMDNSQRRIRDLGNLFMFDNGEDFFANSRFKAIYQNFEIRFQ
jgi:hypothetical protein